MTFLNNNGIDSRVRIIAAAFLKDVKVKPADEPVIQAGVELVSNLLQNISDLAYFAANPDPKGRAER